jgi:thymidylate synthase
MRILAIISGDYGQRHVDNIRAHGPKEWTIEVWRAPAVLPPMIDYPEDHLPDQLPVCDLILSFAELKGVAELLPDIARMTGARSVIAAVDNEAWLPRGLARQLCGWLGDIGVACVTPKPLCSLTETDYGVARRKRISYQDALISEFARHFGQPALDITIDLETRTITSVEVQRDAFCGCARHVARGLLGISVDDAQQQAGLLHHHYPCLASMGIDSAFGDTLMHVSGNVLKDNVAAQVRPFTKVRYYIPRQD